MLRQIRERFEDTMFPYTKNRLTEAWDAFAPQRYDGCSWYFEPIARNQRTGVYELAGWGASEHGRVEFTVTVVGEQFHVFARKQDTNPDTRNIPYMLRPKKCDDVSELFVYLNTMTSFLGLRRVYYSSTRATDLTHRRRTSWPTWRSLWAAAAWIWRQCTRA